MEWLDEDMLDEIEADRMQYLRLGFQRRRVGIRVPSGGIWTNDDNVRESEIDHNRIGHDYGF